MRVVHGLAFAVAAAVLGPVLIDAQEGGGQLHGEASFNEPKYMNLNDHPHPYGIVIGGNEMGTPQQTSMRFAHNTEALVTGLAMAKN